MDVVGFRQRLVTGERLLSSFIKTPHHSAVEIAGIAGFDAVVLDAEHAAFDATRMDISLLACRAANVCSLVRIADATKASVLQALDLGADGLVVPHVVSAEQASGIIASTRYRSGNRGFSNSPRAGEYGRLSMTEHISLHDERISVICQIEDAEAIERVDEIATVEGVDCLFVGRADLAVSFRTFDLGHPEVELAVIHSLRAARDAGKASGLFVSSLDEVERYAREGATFFILGSDQAALRTTWTQQVQQFRANY